MNCPLRSLCFVVLAGVVLLLSTPAAAQPVVDMPRIEVVTPAVPDPAASAPAGTDLPPKPSYPPPTGERVLVGFVRSNRGSEPEMASAIDEHLRKTGMRLIERAPTELWQSCESVECLESLIRRENAEFLILAQLDQQIAANSFVTMTLFDVERRASLQEKAQCWQCNQLLLGYRMNELSDQLIKRCREARKGATVPNQTLDTTIVLPKVDRTEANSITPQVVRPPAPAGATAFFAKLPMSRKILAAALGGLAGATLLTSIILHATNGLDTSIGCELRTDVLQDKCVLQNKPVFATGYALTGALAVGIGFTLFWPTKPAKSPASEVR